jgi:hypothetical protein
MQIGLAKISKFARLMHMAINVLKRKVTLIWLIRAALVLCACVFAILPSCTAANQEDEQALIGHVIKECEHIQFEQNCLDKKLTERFGKICEWSGENGCKANAGAPNTNRRQGAARHNAAREAALIGVSILECSEIQDQDNCNAHSTHQKLGRKCRFSLLRDQCVPVPEGGPVSSCADVLPVDRYNCTTHLINASQTGSFLHCALSTTTADPTCVPLGEENKIPNLCAQRATHACETKNARSAGQTATQCELREAAGKIFCADKSTTHHNATHFVSCGHATHWLKASNIKNRDEFKKGCLDAIGPNGSPLGCDMAEKALEFKCVPSNMAKVVPERCTERGRAHCDDDGRKNCTPAISGGGCANVAHQDCDKADAFLKSLPGPIAFGEACEHALQKSYLLEPTPLGCHVGKYFLKERCVKNAEMLPGACEDRKAEAAICTKGPNGLGKPCTVQLGRCVQASVAATGPNPSEIKGWTTAQFASAKTPETVKHYIADLRADNPDRAEQLENLIEFYKAVFTQRPNGRDPYAISLAANSREKEDRILKALVDKRVMTGAEIRPDNWKGTLTKAKRKLIIPTNESWMTSKYMVHLPGGAGQADSPDEPGVYSYVQLMRKFASDIEDHLAGLLLRDPKK